MGNIPEKSWLNVFTSPQAFRKMLIEEPHRITGMTDEERQRLIKLSDEKLKQEMDQYLDLTNFLMQ